MDMLLIIFATFPKYIAVIETTFSWSSASSSLKALIMRLIGPFVYRSGEWK